MISFWYIYLKSRETLIVTNISVYMFSFAAKLVPG